MCTAVQCRRVAQVLLHLVLSIDNQENLGFIDIIIFLLQFIALLLLGVVYLKVSLEGSNVSSLVSKRGSRRSIAALRDIVKLISLVRVLVRVRVVLRNVNLVERVVAACPGVSSFAIVVVVVVILHHCLVQSSGNVSTTVALALNLEEARQIVVARRLLMLNQRNNVWTDLLVLKYWTTGLLELLDQLFHRDRCVVLAQILLVILLVLREDLLLLSSGALAAATTLFAGDFLTVAAADLLVCTTAAVVGPIDGH